MPATRRVFSGENARPIDDARLRGSTERHFDHVDAEQCGVRVFLRVAAGAVHHLLGRSHAAGAGAIDVERLLVLGNQRMGVRATAGLHRRDLLGIANVGDVKDAHAAEALLAHRLDHALRAAIDAAARLFDGHEQQVAMDRDVALAAGADDRCQQPRALRAFNVVGVEPVEVAHHHVRRCARSELAKSSPPSPRRGPHSARKAGPARLGGPPVAVRWLAAVAAAWRCVHATGICQPADLRIEEAFGTGPRRDQLHAPRRHACIAQAWLQVDARIVGIRRLLLRDRRRRDRRKSRNRRGLHDPQSDIRNPQLHFMISLSIAPIRSISIR